MNPKTKPAPSDNPMTALSDDQLDRRVRVYERKVAADPDGIGAVSRQHLLDCYREIARLREEAGR